MNQTHTHTAPAYPEVDVDDKTVFRVVIRAPIDRVWAELTRTD